ncbi:MAG: phage portal protein [Rickettsia sp.]|nr:phage portal protein [Rickettsia sp.]
MLKKYLNQILSKKSKSSLKDTDKKKFYNWNNITPYIISSTGDKFISNADLYYSNIIVHRCINLISSSISQIKWKLYKKKSLDINLEVIHQHQLIDLLNRPNVSDNFSEIISSVSKNLLLYGNSYLLLEKNPYTEILDLNIINPENIEFLYQKNKMIGYQYLFNGQKHFFDINTTNHINSVLHIKSNHLKNDQYGVSSLKTIYKATNLYSDILDWNQSLLKHASKPSGTLSFKDGHNLTHEQFDRLKEHFYDNFTGASNSGKPLILEGELEWKDLEKHQKLEKFLELKDSLSRDIALAFNIPAQLLGIKGDNTYSNMKEARLAFWEDNIIPFADKIFSKLINFFLIFFRKILILSYD